MLQKTILIGHENYMPADKFLAILQKETRSVKTLISKAELNHRLIDATKGKKVRAVIMTTDQFIVLSSLSSTAISNRFMKETGQPTLHIGGANYIPSHKIISILQPDSAPIVETVKQSRANDLVVNTQRKKQTKSLVFVENGYFFVSSTAAKSLSDRFNKGLNFNKPNSGLEKE